MPKPPEFFSYTQRGKGKSSPLCQLPRYMEYSTQEYAGNKHLKKLRSTTEAVKQDREAELSDMKVWEQEKRFRTEVHEEDFAQGHTEGVEQGFREGIEPGHLKEKGLSS